MKKKKKPLSKATYDGQTVQTDLLIVSLTTIFSRLSPQFTACLHISKKYSKEKDISKTNRFTTSRVFKNKGLL